MVTNTKVKGHRSRSKILLSKVEVAKVKVAGQDHMVEFKVVSGVFYSIDWREMLHTSVSFDT